MENKTLYIIFYLVIIVSSFYFGTLLNKWLKESPRKSLIRKGEKILNQSLPLYKKGNLKGQVNWAKVYTLLQNQPENQEVLDFKKKVRKEMDKLRNN